METVNYGGNKTSFMIQAPGLIFELVRGSLERCSTLADSGQYRKYYTRDQWSSSIGPFVGVKESFITFITDGRHFRWKPLLRIPAFAKRWRHQVTWQDRATRH